MEPGTNDHREASNGPACDAAARPLGARALRHLALVALALVLVACGTVPTGVGLLVRPADGGATCGLDGAVVEGGIQVSIAVVPSFTGVRFVLTGPGVALDELVAAPPYALHLDTTDLEDGTYLLEAYAFPAAGGGPELVAQATFVVANATGGAPEPPSTTPPGAPIDEYAGLHQLFVSPSGSDGNDGSASAPLRTIMAAVQEAVALRRQGIGTRINLHDGVYREALVRSYASSGARIVIQALNPGMAVVSGADVFTGWTCADGVCEHPWDEGWGPDPDPWGIGIGPLALRRELVVVDGANLTQVTSRGALVAGSFFVDDAGRRLYVRPRVGTTLDGALVEVAVRPHTLRLLGLNDLVIKGVHFQHAASPFRRASVEIVDQRNVLLEDAWIEWNGQNGLWLKGTEITIRDVVMNHNGSSGVSGFQVADVLLEDSQSSYNNWRGIRGGYDGWEVGNKFFAAHRMTVRRHVSSHNASRGFWLDIDVEDVVIEGSTFSDNLLDGLFLEKIHGPVVVRDSEFHRNGDAGIATSALNRFTLVGSRLGLNATAAVNVTGDFGATYTNFETGERYTLSNAHWTWRDNDMTAPENAPVIRTTHPRSEWDALMATSTFDENTYTACVVGAFGIPGRLVTFDEWRLASGQDGASEFVFTTVASLP